MILKCLAAFFALFALDFVWAIYTKAITANRAVYASVTAMALIGLSGTAAIVYTSDPWMLIPAMAGAFFGTFAAIKCPDSIPFWKSQS